MKAHTSAPWKHLGWLHNLRVTKSAGATHLLTPLPDALVELERRKRDPVLKKKIEEYLKGDIPPYFGESPVLYLARHIATPNFETLRFLHLVEPLGLPTVIGQDLKDKFVPKNQLKRALGKLHVSTGITRHGLEFKEHFENVRIVDFNTESGKLFRDITTVWGEPLADFHNGLFKELASTDVTIVDDSAWIDRHHRGRLVSHYRKFLTLFILHGVLFEDYSLDDKEERAFIRKVLEPAFRTVEKKFGCRPLIAQLTPTTVESPEYWISYPSKVLGLVRKRMSCTTI
jgi:hypothetical protein